MRSRVALLPAAVVRHRVRVSRWRLERRKISITAALNGFPPPVKLSSGLAALELLKLGELLLRARWLLGNERHGAVGDESAGGDVPGAGKFIAGVPQLVRDGDGSGVTGAGADELHPGFAFRGHFPGEHGSEFLLGPDGLACLGELRFQDIPKVHKHLNVKGRVGQPRFGQRAS